MMSNSGRKTRTRRTTRARLCAATAVVLLGGASAVGMAAPAASAVGSEGGYSFNAATPIGPGTVRQMLVVGEHLFWRVDLRAGQTLIVKLDGDLPAQYRGDITDSFEYEVYDANRARVSCTNDVGGGLVDPNITHVAHQCEPFTVDGDNNPPGTYYIQAAMREPNASDRGKLMPITLDVAVQGQAKPDPADAFDFGAGAPGAPPVAATSAPPSAKPSATSSPDPASANAKADKGGDDGTNLAVPIGASAGGVVLGALAGYLVRIRRSAFSSER